MVFGRRQKGGYKLITQSEASLYNKRRTRIRIWTVFNVGNENSTFPWQGKQREISPPFLKSRQDARKSGLGFQERFIYKVEPINVMVFERLIM